MVLNLMIKYSIVALLQSEHKQNSVKYAVLCRVSTSSSLTCNLYIYFYELIEFALKVNTQSVTLLKFIMF